MQYCFFVIPSGFHIFIIGYGVKFSTFSGQILFYHKYRTFESPLFFITLHKHTLSHTRARARKEWTQNGYNLSTSIFAKFSYSVCNINVCSFQAFNKFYYHFIHFLACFFGVSTIDTLYSDLIGSLILLFHLISPVFIASWIC